MCDVQSIVALQGMHSGTTKVCVHYYNVHLRLNRYFIAGVTGHLFGSTVWSNAPVT